MSADSPLASKNTCLPSISAAPAILVAAVGMSLLSPIPARAADYLWFGGDGDFDNFENWIPAMVPGAGDNALLDGGKASIVEDDFLELAYIRITRSGSPSNAAAHLVQTGGDVLLTNLRVGDGNTHTGTFEMSGGSMDIRSGSGQVIVGANAGSDGTMTVKGSATFTNFGTTNLRFAVGDTGTGRLFIQDFGQVTTTRMSIANNPAGVGTLEVSGSGKLDVVEHLLISRNDGAGTATISGSAEVTVGTVVTLGEGGTGSGLGILNLNGGSLSATGITRGSGAGTVNFNGGIVRATVDSFDYFSGFEDDDLQVQSGGLKFDTQVHSVMINQRMGGSGGLAKTGAGTLTLNGTNTFTGFSQVSQGTLVVSNGATIGGVLAVAADATLRVESAVALDDAIVLTLVSGSNVDLAFSGVETIGALWINGTPLTPDQYTLEELTQLGSGVNFTGNGGAVLNVTSTVPEPATLALLGMGAVLAGWRLRLRG